MNLEGELVPSQGGNDAAELLLQLGVGDVQLAGEAELGEGDVELAGADDFVELPLSFGMETEEWSAFSKKFKSSSSYSEQVRAFLVWYLKK